MPKGKKQGRATNGAGGIRKRPDGRYDAYLTVRGKRVRTTRATYQAADRWLTDQKQRRNKGYGVESDNLTFGAYLRQWLKVGVLPSVKEGTYLQYKSNVERHIVPALGNLKLKNLNASHFGGLYAELAEEKGLAPATVYGVHATARRALTQALRWEMVARNAAAVAVAPRPDEEEVVPFSHDESRAFLEAAKQHRLYAMYALALATGARHGELLALEWEDVTLLGEEGARVAIRRTLARAVSKKDGGQSHKVGTPKTGKARVVSVGPNTAAILRAHRKCLKEEKLAYGSGHEDTALLFPNESGRPLLHRPSLRQFRKVCLAAGLPADTRFHTLRHTFATVHLTEGTPAKVVSEALGHSTIAQTMDTYSHLLPTLQQSAAEVLDGVLFG